MRKSSVIPSHIFKLTNGGKTAIDINQLPECFITLFSNTRHEQMYLLMLSHIKHYISMEKIADGGPEMIRTDYNFIYDRITMFNAKYIALAHNHLNNKYPSVEDIMFTKKLCSDLSKNGIYLLDHLLVFNNTSMSMKNSGYI